MNSNSKIVEQSSIIENRRLLQVNRTSTSNSIEIANKPISIYVHLDLKGAAPKISYFEQLFPLLRKWGATGLCLEYEDMFPFDGIVSSIKHLQAYSKDDINKINNLAKENQLDVMPLLQTYGSFFDDRLFFCLILVLLGHLEFLLKIDQFKDLRENPKYPQVISPCLNQTYPILFTMIDQYLALHPDIRLFHIGHDEVYYFLSNPACEQFKRATGIQDQYELFAYHLAIIVRYIREKNPKISLFVWHDVLQNLKLEMLQKYNLTSMINPVLWSYREDMSVEGFVVGTQANLFGLYQSLWGASAYKGSTNEIATISDVNHHYESKLLN